MDSPVCLRKVSSVPGDDADRQTHLGRQVQPVNRPNRFREVITSKTNLRTRRSQRADMDVSVTNLGPLLLSSRQMHRKYTRRKFMSTKEILEEVGCVQARDALEGEAKETAAWIAHKVARLALHGNEALLIDREGAK